MEDLKLSLAEHLQELRSRLWKIIIAIIALGGAALFFARDLFELLMRPVLAALPEESRSLIYTSGIEEVNVLLKVGLYAGVFLATPIALHQLWLFVAPGLLKEERRLIGPFVLIGTLFFAAGAVFCYSVVLPQMFKFLLTPGESGAVRDQIEVTRAQVEDASRLLFLGEPVRAAELARTAGAALERGGGVPAPPVLSDSRVELRERLDRFGRLLDAAVARPVAGPQRAAVAEAIVLHEQAERLLHEDQLPRASVRLEDAVASLGRGLRGDGEGLAAIWGAHRHLAAAAGKLGKEEWTRPMLSMKEQLSLVLVLEVAFGAIFELPLLMALLAMVGVLKFRWVARSQRYAVLGCVVVAAIITPTGDIVNLSLMAVPMIVCFELGLVLVWIFERRRDTRLAAEAQDDDAAAA